MANVGRLVKETIAKEITDRLSEQPNFFVTTINRLPAAEADSLRLKLSVSKAKLILIKRRIGKRAIEQLKISGLADLLEGSVGLVLPGDDVLPAAKLIVEFNKAHEDFIAVRGGIVDGQLLDKARVEQLASLPPKPVLLAQLVFTIESPIADLIGVVEQLIGDVAWLAEQAAEKKPKVEAAPAAPAPAAPAAEAPAADKPATPDASAGSAPAEGQPTS